MRLALIVNDARPSAAMRIADDHARRLRARGHVVDILVATAADDEPQPFPGHTVLPDGTTPLSERLATAFDVAVSTSWRAWYRMFALDAKAYARLPLADEDLRADAVTSALAERSSHDPASTTLAPAGDASAALVEEGLTEVLAQARPIPAWRRAELAAVADLLDARARPPAPPTPRGSPALARLARQGARLTRLARKLWHRVAPPRLEPRPAPSPHDPEPAGPLRPGEPVLFVGQPQYFRGAYLDAVIAGWGAALPVAITRTHELVALPALVDKMGARTCVVFQPELLAPFPEVARALTAGGVRLIAYSTEPVPQDGIAEAHWDQLRRLENLRRAGGVRWDLVIHFDPASRGVVAGLDLGPLAIHPLPVSTALFHPVPARADFDVCFLGWSTPHREAFLHPLECRYRVVHGAHGIFDEEARDLMNRSRIVVNLHAHAYTSFENRCVHALFCGRPLVSEPLSNTLLRPGVDFLIARTPEELAAHAAALLEDGVPPPTPRFARSTFLASSLRELLADHAR